MGISRIAQEIVACNTNSWKKSKRKSKLIRRKKEETRFIFLL